jgi:hypothetical protein
MTRQQWAQRTSWDEVCKRQAGRRKYNQWRQTLVNERRHEVWRLLIVGGLDRWGLLTEVAHLVGVSRWTIARDRKALMRTLV